jgi:hypothetical protein
VGNGGEAGDGAGAGNQGNVFGDGVFRASPGRHQYGGDRRYQQNFNNYNDARRNGGYNGNYNSRRFTTNTNSNSRNANSGYAAAVPGLSEAQQTLVSEATEAFARQLAGRAELHSLESQSTSRGVVDQLVAPLV